MGRKLENAFKSLLQRSGYSDNATHEIMKWYQPKRNGKAIKKWHTKAMLVDFTKTKITILS